ncbi:MAG TPA: hypothetical protein PL054_07780 [Clostridia bacterium]|nr:MAG: Bacterial alpha-L-rhamnosidase [Firmicutes bacterium ADurb.Bin146]HOD93759.1 hypothetical protein [Clostridia bacterium]
MGQYIFKQAEPVWAAKLQNEMNVHMGFFSKVGKCRASVNLACSTSYQIFVNGTFVAAGPARAAHGYYRVDEVDITSYLSEDINHVAIIVWGYCINAYSILDQPSFLTCEIICDDEVIAATGVKGFYAYLLDDYVRKVQRYTYQRAFTESYVMDVHSSGWRKDLNNQQVSIEICDKKEYINRNVRYPDYEKLYPIKNVVIGKHHTVYPESYRMPWHLKVTSEKYKQFKSTELEENINEIIQNIAYDSDNIERRELIEELKLSENEYALYEFEREATGFISFKAVCDEPCEFLMIYDEMLINGVPDPIRIHGLWVNKYKLEPGEYDLVFFEPVSMKYLNTVMLKGKANISSLHMIEYKHPNIDRKLNTENPDLLKIYDAAVETFRQNALDIFMDCPSRERAGWLCDSFFTSRVEYLLTGKSLIEKNFLENFLLPDTFTDLPKGILPMCYPSDHYDGNFIPNWAMWLVLELYEYKQRTNDVQMINAFKPKVYALLEYFKGFLNSDGLLQNLEKWVFVEWSFANKLVQDVNFPTNMLYALMLERVSELYDDNDKLIQAEGIRRKIRELSYNGQFFRDRMLLTDDILKVTEECTEVCQYYAFFTKTATKKLYPQLWKTLVKDFGPDRVEKNLHPNIYPANAFVGTYLRLELLSEQRLYKQLLSESVGFFKYMADRTGTLWENKTDSASLNHGFASHVAIWLDKAVNTLK